MDTEKPTQETVDLEKFCLEKVLKQDNLAKSITLLGSESSRSFI